MTAVKAQQHVLVFLSAPPDTARAELAAVRASHPDAQLTVYLREAERERLGSAIDDCFVEHDKPARGKLSFVRELRGRLYDEAIVLDFGQWSYFPARCLFFLCRAQRRTVRSERGDFAFALLQPLPLLRHLAYRHKHRTGPIAGLPPGTPMPFVLAAYRKTFGLLFGLGWTVLEYGWRRLRS